MIMEDDEKLFSNAQTTKKLMISREILLKELEDGKIK